MIKPIRDQILIKNAIQENITKSGIVLPQSRARGLYAWGTVKAVGSRVKYVKVGDRVRFTKLLGWPLDDGMSIVKEEICDIIDTEGKEDGSRQVVS